MTAAIDRPTILVFNRYYLPGYRAGGPIRTLANLVERLGDEMMFRVVTFDRDAAASGGYGMVNIDRWNRVGKADVYYVSPEARSLRLVIQLMRNTPHEVVYLNSLLDPAFTLRVLLARRFRLVPRKPVVLAPRGEFSSGAWNLKRRKKMAYLSVIRRMGLLRGVVWQASSEFEREDICRALRLKNTDETQGIVAIAPDLGPRTEMQGKTKVSRRVGDALRVCYLSRISPMKNLDYALRVLERVRVSVQFDIYGPISEPAYWEKCQQLIRVLPKHVYVTYHGDVRPDLVVATLAEHDLFFLPTRGENYGHVIREALMAGLVVLISDKTPWNELERRKVGWALRLEDPGVFARTIEDVSTWDVDRVAISAQSARAYAAAIAEDDSVLEANRSLFFGIFGGRHAKC